MWPGCLTCTTSVRSDYQRSHTFDANRFLYPFPVTCQPYLQNCAFSDGRNELNESKNKQPWELPFVGDYAVERLVFWPWRFYTMPTR